MSNGYRARKPDTYRQNMYVEGQLSISGKKFYYIESGDSAAYLPQIAMIDEKVAKAALAHQGIILPKQAWLKLQEEIFCISEFKPALIADHPGWNGVAYVFNEDEVIADTDQEIKVVALDVDPRKSAKNGSFEGWLANVAQPLTGQYLPMFLMMAVMTAPLIKIIQRRENIAFEISGKPGCGKSTLFGLIISAFGEPSVEMFNVTLDGL